MSEQYNELWDETDPNEGSGQQTPPGGKLRDFAEAQQKRAKELAEENANLRSQIRRSELSGALSEAGYDPAVIALVPDSVTDKDGMSTWLETHGSFLNKTAKQEEPVQEELAQPETTLSPEEQAALDATSGAPQGGPPSASKSGEDRLKQAKSRDEYWQIMAELQHEGQQ